MDSALVVALVTGGFTMAAALAAGVASYVAIGRSKAAEEDVERLRAALQRAARDADRKADAAGILDNNRRPLLASAVELKRRLGNIMFNDFLYYLHSHGHRSDVALRSTLYRLAYFLGCRESLQRQLTYLDYEDGERTAEVLAALEDVSAKLATSALDAEGGKPRLMLWKDEQRAIGGLMQDNNGATGVLGFEKFYQNYDDSFGIWFSGFADDLAQEGIEGAQRLSQLYGSLEVLIALLDTDEVYKGRH